ncbi:MAG: hypothetical protein M1828_006461 [Chrysothrix sp. TS-e1954]|nr:MAG: hypothetical protein M1828_006461 [Chrysothrix sp. TS-e1954]
MDGQHHSSMNRQNPSGVNGTNGINGTGINGHSEPAQAHPGSMSLEIQALCGPLLNYKRMSNTNTANPIWHGSVLVVATPGPARPGLTLRYVGPVASSGMTNGQSQRKPSFVDPNSPTGNTPTTAKPRNFKGERLYEDRRGTFWRFSIELPLQEEESRWQYALPGFRRVKDGKTTEASTKEFVVPAASESMRIMFHSCNGFSVGTDEDAWSGCALWNDVLRRHEQNPIHVMIGGGDQIYNDQIRIEGPLKEWCDMLDPVKKEKHPFGEPFREACDEYYFHNYVKWYGIEPFASANGCIPQINVWDDHDIIDGFGSYKDTFMKAAVFKGIGSIAYKYYMLFQHHVPPPLSTFTTDAPSTMNPQDARPDPVQIQNSYVMKEKEEDPSYVFGRTPGPYIEERSRSLCCQLGANILFAGIDARTERTRHKINYDETYDILFNRVSRELEASRGRIKHFILLLGVPIAYPRLQWLENILQSPLVGAVRFANKRFGVANGLFNTFDGGVDLLDDLDDHYTAHQHKHERKQLIHRLQTLSRNHSVRITILGGDVHLAAFGRFYSNPAMQIAPENDPRFITNIVSSAITNHPPPAAVANLLARRNKIHHLDRETDETLLNLFDKDPSAGHAGVKPKSANANHCTMPSRNYALLSLSSPHPSAPLQPNGVNAPNGTTAHEHHLGTREVAPLHNKSQIQHHRFSRKPGNPREALHPGEGSCGTTHAAAAGEARTGLAGQWGLDVCYRVEIDNGDRRGATMGYGLSIPGLEIRHQAFQGHLGGDGTVDGEGRR